MGFLLSLLCALQYPPMNVTVFHSTSVYCLFNSFFWLTTKKSSKPRITGPLWGESTGYRWIPYTKGQYCGKYFHEMTSSWSSWYDQCYTFVSAKLHATSHYILDQAPVPLTVFWWNLKFDQNLERSSLKYAPPIKKFSTCPKFRCDQ